MGEYPGNTPRGRRCEPIWRVLMAGGHDGAGIGHPWWHFGAGGGNIAGDMNLMLSHCVALGLCRETQDEVVAAEQVGETVRALQAKALAAEQEVAAIQARESARLDAKLADVRRRHPFLSIERCAALLDFEESIT